MRRITIMAGFIAATAVAAAHAQPSTDGAANGHTEPNPGRVRTLEQRDGVAPSSGQQRATSDELSQMGAQLKRQAAQDAKQAAQAPKPVPP